MGLLSAGGGDDRLLVGMAVFGIVLSLMVTAMVPMVIPEWDAENGDSLAEARQKMENFTGETMVSQSPWQLTAVRTPYTNLSADPVISEYGWMYGTEITSSDDYEYIGEYTVKLDPDQKSSYRLSQGGSGYITTDRIEMDFWEEASYWWSHMSQWFSDSYWDDATVTTDHMAFNFTGYMYHFDPAYDIDTTGHSSTLVSFDNTLQAGDIRGNVNQTSGGFSASDTGTWIQVQLPMNGETSKHYYVASGAIYWAPDTSGTMHMYTVPTTSGQSEDISLTFKASSKYSGLYELIPTATASGLNIYIPYSAVGSQSYNGTRDNASLNIVWYDNSNGSGISGGLVLYSNKTHAIIADYAATDIINNYDSDTGYASKFLLNFEGISVYMYIQFDQDVLANGTPIGQAWNEGSWTVAFSSTSASGLMDLTSGDLSSTMGNMLDTFISIFTFDMPNCPAVWQIVFWVLAVLPLEMCLILFLSRFGALAMGAGVLGNVLAYIGLT